MRLSVLILRVSTLLRRLSPFVGLPFARGDRASFPMAVIALPPSYLGLGLMGALSSISSRSSERHTDSRSVHISYLSVLSSGISSPDGGAAFFLQVSVSFPLFRLPSCKRRLEPLMSPRLVAWPLGTDFLFWQADYWYPSARPVIEFSCCFLRGRAFIEATIFFHDAKI